MRSWIVLTIALVVCVAAVLVVREQRAANDRILESLNQVKASLDEHTRRARALEQQVTDLTARVSSLETEVTELKRRIATLSRRPTKTARVEPAPIDAVALTPMAPEAPSTPMAPPTSEADVHIATTSLAIPLTLIAPLAPGAPPAPLAPMAPKAPSYLTNPKLAKSMLITYAALHIADMMTTTMAINRGAREANPLVRGYADSPAAMIGVKTMVSVGTILAMDRVWRNKPEVASVTLMGLNATMAAVAVHNARVAQN